MPHIAAVLPDLILVLPASERRLDGLGPRRVRENLAGVVRGRLEHEQLARTGQLALAVMDSDHTRSVGSQFRGGLMAEVTDELSDKAVWCRGGDFCTRVEHAASVRPPGEAGRAGGH